MKKLLFLGLLFSLPVVSKQDVVNSRQGATAPKKESNKKQMSQNVAIELFMPKGQIKSQTEMSLDMFAKSNNVKNAEQMKKDFFDSYEKAIKEEVATLLEFELELEDLQKILDWQKSKTAQKLNDINTKAQNALMSVGQKAFASAQKHIPKDNSKDTKVNSAKK